MAFLFVLLLVTPGPSAGQAREPDPVPSLTFRHHLDLELLGDLAGDDAGWPNARLTLQRRRTLGSSFTVSALVLTEPLSRSRSIAVGEVMSFPVGAVLLEPFAEVGAGWLDAREEHGSYTVLDPDGSLRPVLRYRALQGEVRVVGAGASVSRVVWERARVRVSAGYWQLAQWASVARACGPVESPFMRR